MDVYTIISTAIDTAIDVYMMACTVIGSIWVGCTIGSRIRKAMDKRRGERL